ncbi:FAD-dependent oxidoreductase [Pelagibacterium lacus]|nr:FAD-dependent oxidoreductase [Pelagibacterium lacus]
MTLSHRLDGDLPAEFSTPLIDRQRPIRFRLNGRPLLAFEGDSVLSAALANGWGAAGMADGSPLALDPASAPAVLVAGNEARPDLAMPMALCPAMDGVSLVTAPARRAPSNPFARLLGGAGSGLGLAYGAGDPAPGGWLDAPASRAMTTDMLVIGGGVAGLAAAEAASRQGKRVVIVEREAVLGGLSPLFGRAEGEPAPEELIADLAGAIGRSGLVTLLLGTHAFALAGTSVRAIRVTRAGGIPAPEIIEIAADGVVLATGVEDRLPLFAGNRLPGVVDAATAWRLAARYNLWPGRTAHIHTATNAGYRMALLGAASGRTITRTSDPRPAPQTRFIEFCKAYGYRLGWGTSIAAARLDRRRNLQLVLADSRTGKVQDELETCERLVMSGGWQPTLDLWALAGGALRWTAERGCLMADGPLEGVAVAGSAAGYHSLPGCRNHGAAIAAAMPEATHAVVADPQIDPVFETPDGAPTRMAPATRDAAPAWLSARRAGRLPPPEAQGVARLFAGPAPIRAPRALAVTDVAGLVIAGHVEPAAARAFSARHCVLPVRLGPAEEHPDRAEPRPEPVPGYLAGRFGPQQSRWRLAAETSRRFTPGCLVFVNTDARSPLAAVGVVLAHTPAGIEALVTGEGFGAGDTLYIRDGHVAVSARLAERL